MKKKVLIIISVILLLILVLLFGLGIIPKKIGKIFAVKYMNDNFPKMELEYVGIEWNKVYGDYIISFKDRENQYYRCVIGPQYCPISIGQGVFEIEQTYLEKYKEPTTIKQKIAKSTFMINSNEREDFVSKEKINNNMNLLDTFSTIMNSSNIQNKVREKYPNANDIELEIENGTEIFKVIYVCDNYSDQECIEITNKYIELFTKEIVDIYNINKISIIDSASISTRIIEK